MAQPVSHSQPFDSRGRAYVWTHFGFAGRVTAIGFLVGLEVLASTVWLDGDTPMPEGQWLAQSIHAWAPWAIRFAVAFLGIFCSFAYLRTPTPARRVAMRQIDQAVADVPVKWFLVAGHFVLIAVWGLLSIAVYGTGLRWIVPNHASVGWLATGFLSVACAVFSVVPLRVWRQVKKETGRLWMYAAASAGVIVGATVISRSLWKPTARLTFAIVKLILRPFVSDLVTQPEVMRIGTHHFWVLISDQCSGLEGIGLLLIFCTLWLMLFRDEIRFPQALSILPAGIVLIFVLNSVRIAALVLIGNAGAKEIAAGGFHSQAGWILFNSVAFGLCFVAGRTPWILKEELAKQETSKAIAQKVETRNPIAPYLMPFLAILAAGMLARLVSGQFEWFYSLRLFAAAGALWAFRDAYRKLDWRFGWLGVLCGLAVFVLWLFVDQIMGTVSAAMPAKLATAPGTLRAAWIGLRALTAVLIIPVAEELAFRGFLFRRIIAANFESVSFRTLRWTGLVGSSVLFGLMHGERWIAGTAAGLLYAFAMQGRGRLGEAVMAHAVTNGLIATYVVAFGQWQLW